MTDTITYGIDSLFYKVFTFIERISLGHSLAKLFNEQKCKILAIDVYVIFKCFAATSLLFFKAYQVSNRSIHWLLIILSVYMIAETMNALIKKIFYPTAIALPSYRRSSLLIIFNWLEIIFQYAILYALSNTLFVSGKIPSPFTYFYFSFLNSVTMGLDGAILVRIGKLISVCQITTFVIFLSLFFSHNFGKLSDVKAKQIAN